MIAATNRGSAWRASRVCSVAAAVTGAQSSALRYPRRRQLRQRRRSRQPQADAGRTAYAQQCAACHGDTLQGGQFGPTLKGRTFQNKWGGAPLGELYAYIRRSMPPAAVGQLSEATYAALLARILADNGAAAGQVALVTEPEVLAKVTVPGQALSSQAQLRPTSGLMSITPGVRVPPWPQRANPLDRITPVTQAMIANPAPG